MPMPKIDFKKYAEELEKVQKSFEKISFTTNESKEMLQLKIAGTALQIAHWMNKLEAKVLTLYSCPYEACSVNLIYKNKLSAVNMIPHLNDEHKWSYTQIADWLDSLDETIEIPKESWPTYFD